MGFWDVAKRVATGVATGGASELWQQNPFGTPSGSVRTSQFGQIDPEGKLGGAAEKAGQFGTYGALDYGQMTGEMAKDRSFLRDLQSGKNSISAEQLRQGLGQNLAAQQAMAAGARPANAPMAARTAAMTAGRLGSGLAGQQALAGLQERQMAGQSLANLNLGQRAQDVQAALGGQQNALQGYGMLEQARTGRYGADMGVPSRTEMVLGGLQGLGEAAMKASDKTLKVELSGGDKDAQQFLDALVARKYRYKPEALADAAEDLAPAAQATPAARRYSYDPALTARSAPRRRYSYDPALARRAQLGVNAQDLERGGPLGRAAVVEAPAGKSVYAPSFVHALAAGVGQLNRRLRALEGGHELQSPDEAAMGLYRPSR